MTETIIDLKKITVASMALLVIQALGKAHWFG